MKLPAPWQQCTVPKMFAHAVASRGGRTALMYKGGGIWQQVSWREYGPEISTSAYSSSTSASVSESSAASSATGLASWRTRWVGAPIAISSADSTESSFIARSRTTSSPLVISPVEISETISACARGVTSASGCATSICGVHRGLRIRMRALASASTSHVASLNTSVLLGRSQRSYASI